MQALLQVIQTPEYRIQAPESAFDADTRPPGLLRYKLNCDCIDSEPDVNHGQRSFPYFCPWPRVKART
jgi:hypothetical protein